jgi:hypothetical protein
MTDFVEETLPRAVSNGWTRMSFSSSVSNLIVGLLYRIEDRFHGKSHHVAERQTQNNPDTSCPPATHKDYVGVAVVEDQFFRGPGEKKPPRRPRRRSVRRRGRRGVSKRPCPNQRR